MSSFYSSCLYLNFPFLELLIWRVPLSTLLPFFTLIIPPHFLHHYNYFYLFLSLLTLSPEVGIKACGDYSCFSLLPYMWHLGYYLHSRCSLNICCMRQTKSLDISVPLFLPLWTGNIKWYLPHRVTMSSTWIHTYKTLRKVHRVLFVVIITFLY